MRRWLIPSLVLSLLMLLASPQAAHAEDKAKALKLLSKGDALLERGDRYWASNKPEKGQQAYEQALSLYRQAYDAFPSPKIYYPIAEAEQKLGRFLDAMRHYQAMLKETDNPDPAVVAQVDEAIAEVRKNLSVLELLVEQEGAEVRIDGELIGITPLDGLHYFVPGRLKYSVTLKDYTPTEETLETKRGEKVSRQLNLDPMPVVVKPKRVETPRAVVETGVSKKPMTISFALGGGFLLAATFTAIQAKARHDRYQDENELDEDREIARTRGKTYRLATDVLLGGATLAVGYGAYYYYTKYKPGIRSERKTSALWLTPYASQDGGGLAMGAQF